MSELVRVARLLASSASGTKRQIDALQQFRPLLGVQRN